MYPLFGMNSKKRLISTQKFLSCILASFLFAYLQNSFMGLMRQTLRILMYARTPILPARIILEWLLQSPRILNRYLPVFEPNETESNNPTSKGKTKFVCSFFHSPFISHFLGVRIWVFFVLGTQNWARDCREKKNLKFSYQIVTFNDLKTTFYVTVTPPLQVSKLTRRTIEGESTFGCTQ